MNDAKRHYLLEEYRSLRSEIDSYSDQKRQLEIYVVTALLVIYGWIKSEASTPTITNLAVLSPIAIVVFGIWRANFYNRVIKKQAEYIRTVIENEFLTEHEGWEKFWSKSGDLKHLFWSERAFWFILLCMTISVAIISYFFLS